MGRSLRRKPPNRTSARCEPRRPPDQGRRLVRTCLSCCSRSARRNGVDRNCLPNRELEALATGPQGSKICRACGSGIGRDARLVEGRPPSRSKMAKIKMSRLAKREPSMRMHHDTPARTGRLRRCGTTRSSLGEPGRACSDSGLGQFDGTTPISSLARDDTRSRAGICVGHDGGAVTMDYSPQRLTVQLDRESRVVSAKCG